MTDATTKAIERGRSPDPGTRRGSNRATRKRNANRPIATITDRNITQRAISRLGAVAPPEMLGTANFGAGPGWGRRRR